MLPSYSTLDASAISHNLQVGGGGRLLMTDVASFVKPHRGRGAFHLSNYVI